MKPMLDAICEITGDNALSARMVQQGQIQPGFRIDRLLIDQAVVVGLVDARSLATQPAVSRCRLRETAGISRRLRRMLHDRRRHGAPVSTCYARARGGSARLKFGPQQRPSSVLYCSEPPRLAGCNP